jgi:gamma-tubulin complex component 5
MRETSAQEYKKLRDAAIKSAKSAQYGRANQFEVKSMLNGLIEKFHVINREDLGRALDHSLRELSTISSKWTPDMLSLLLQLSDRPAEKTGFERLKPRVPSPEVAQLTWEEILADDPLSDDELWRDITHSPNSSDEEDDILLSDETLGTHEQQAMGDEDDSLSSKLSILSPDQHILASLQPVQFWRELPVRGQEPADQLSNRSIPELHAIRESLLMMQGLPTSLFSMTATNGSVVYVGKLSLSEVNAFVFAATMRSLAEIGSVVAKVRVWSRRPQALSLMQSFQYAVLKRIRDFDREIDGIERQYVSPARLVTISIIRVHEMTRSLSRPLLHLAALIARLPQPSSQFMHLELLYEAICASQASGDTASYEYLARIFFESLQVYLRPIREWMEHGKITNDHDFFFIKENPVTVATSSVWHDRFMLRQTDDGVLPAPAFLHPAGRLILNAGKSVVLLQKLGVPCSASTVKEPALDFESICSSTNLSLAPFSALFTTAFDDWIRNRYGPSSFILREKLFNDCQLWNSLDALEDFYFAKDGTRLQQLADAIFERLDSRRAQSWNDRYLILESVRNVFRNSTSVVPEQISVRTARTKSSARSVTALSCILIDYEVSCELHSACPANSIYKLSWPVLNVIQSPSLSSYQRVFRLMLQIYRAKYLLCQKDPLSGTDYLAASLLHRLQWFVDTLKSHLVHSVLLPSSVTLREQLAAAEDVDQMARVHQAFIASIQARCLITKSLTPIHNVIIAILDLAVQFTDARRQQAGLRVQGGKPTRAAHNMATSRKPKTSRRYSGKGDSTASSSDENDADDDGDDNDYDADTEVVSGRESSHAERMEKMRDEFGRLCSFVITGLRGISRAGGEASWEMLADRLDWTRIAR